MKSFISKLSKLIEILVASMLAVMFFTFIIQIISRYFFTPIGWTVEIITVLWIWVIFIGNAFVVRGKDHVTFDILYLIAPNKIQRTLAFISAFVVGAVFLWSFLPTVDYMDFLSIKKTPLMKIPYNWFFACYVIFVIMAIAHSIHKIIAAIRNKLPESPNEVFVEKTSGDKS